MMKHPKLGSKKTIPQRRELRKEATQAEQLLWKQLLGNNLNFKFRRQCGIGPYITDFCCRKLKLIIEIDGDIHTHPRQIHKDEARQHYLESLGFKVIRYTNTEVIENIEGVLTDLTNQIQRLQNAPSP